MEIHKGRFSPFRFLDKLPEKEEEITVRSFSLTKLTVFDQGSAWIDSGPDPELVTELLVRRGYAVAYQTPDLGTQGGWEYLARKVELLDEKYDKILKRNRINHKKYHDISEELHDRFNAFTFSSDSEENWKKGQVALNSYQNLTRTLRVYSYWDSTHVPTYVIRRRFSRAIFEPILLRFEVPLFRAYNFFAAQPVISIHGSGVGCLSLWTDALLGKEETALTAQDLDYLFATSGEVRVTVALSKKFSEMAETGTHKLERKTELDKDVSMSYAPEVYDLEYQVWKGTFWDVLSLYIDLVHSYSLELMGRGKTAENLSSLRKTGLLDYLLVHVYDVGKTIDDPFEQVVKKYPRQIYRLLEGWRDTDSVTTEERVIDEIVDLSPTEKASWILSHRMMIKFYTSDIAEEMEGGFEEENTPEYDEVAEVAELEMLCCLRHLLDGYDLLLSETLARKKGTANLMKIEEKITNGLEEIYPARHESNPILRDWWELAETRLGVNELSKAVKTKLEEIHRIIVTRAEERISNRLLYLTIILSVLTFLTVVIALFR
jgi:hypothetical protein